MTLRADSARDSDSGVLWAPDGRPAEVKGWPRLCRRNALEPAADPYNSRRARACSREQAGRAGSTASHRRPSTTGGIT